MKHILLLISIIATITAYSQNYNYLGSYTSNGTPLYLENPGDIVSTATLEMISNSLPESYPVPDYNPHYISSGYDTDVILNEDADIYVTFVSEGAGYKNVLGFYTYDVNNPSSTAPQPEYVTIIFPNASALGSGGGLQAGDKVKIGNFPANTGIGWVLLANAWNASTSSVWYGNWQLYSNPDYNPESQEDLRHHNVLLSDPENERVILGFEDIRRDYNSCDNDFNDAVFYVTSSPYSAMVTTNYADVNSASNVTSGNSGGLESNGNLADLVAKRNFKRKTSGNNLDKKHFQKRYAKGKNTKKGFANSLESYFPDTGMYGTETTYISSPDDLLGITNAKEVFSIDIYEGSKRVSAALGTRTEGAVYDHTKVICDRLNNSSLEDVRTVTVRGHKVINSKIKRATGETEFTLSFSVKLGLASESNELYSFWNIGQYPSGDYYNFQIWGSSFSQVFAIANHIMDTFSSEKALDSKAIEDVIPTVFVKSGYYSNGAVHLDIINKASATLLDFDGNYTKTEVSDRFNMKETITLTGSYFETIHVTTGILFDIGISLSTQSSIQKDALYLADGPWGLDYLEDYATVNTFYVDNDPIQYKEGVYEVERQPSVSGDVKGNINLFRHLLPGDQTLDISDFNTITFNIANDQPVELVLMPEGLTNWNERLRYTIPANASETFYVISFDDFVDDNGNSGTLTDIKTVVYSVIGDYTTYKSFVLAINSLAFTTKSTLSVNETVIAKASLINYPNPFKTTTTIKVPYTTQSIDLKVMDLLGRIVDVKHLKSNNKKVTYKAPNLTKGIYKYMIIDDSSKHYVGTFLIR